MNIVEAKQISIVEYLKQLGYKPTKSKCGQYWFKSPFRSERTASFKVDNNKNEWYDFGIADGGDIILLGKYLFNTSSVSEVLSILSNQVPCADKLRIKPSTIQPPPIEDMFRNVEVIPLNNYALLSYVKSRLIDINLAKQYCHEIHYKLRQRSYFGIAFGNRSGGYEIRNSYYKGCYKNKDITIVYMCNGVIQQHICIFEGFMDFLSYLTLQKVNNRFICIEASTDYIILNSIGNLKKCLEELEKFSYIHCYLDNDTAGQKTVETIRGLYEQKVFDESVRYQEYKDLNDYLLGKKK